MVFKLQFFLISSLLYVLLDPHKNFDVGRELINFYFFLFKCKTKLCILGYVSQNL
jgi:hypothetical protein